MELARDLAIIRRWAWLPMLLSVIAGGLAAVVSSRLTPIYEASTTVMVRPAQTSSQAAYYLTLDEVAKTYAQLMTERPLLQQVIAQLRLQATPPQLQNHIVVVPEKDTELLNVKVEDHNPGMAAAIANTLVKDFIAQNQAQAQAQISASLQNLQSQANDLERQMTADGRSIAILSAKPSLNPDQQAQLTNLQQRQAANSATYATLVKNLEDVRGSQLARYEALDIAEPASEPAAPIRPNLPLNITVAAILGILAGIGVAFLAEHLDNTVKSEEDVRRWLNLSVLGTLAYCKDEREAGKELITIREPRAPASEAFRELRTNLLFSRLDGGLKTVVVTSSGPSEGKTRTAANLAVTLAQAGHTCVLVDADFRRPAVHRLFRRVDQRGLSNMILENRVIPEFVHETQLQSLRFVASGTMPPNPSEMLGSQRMLRITHELLANFDVVVFDTPPLNAVTDAALLAARADATILVIEAGRTTRPMAARARDTIQKVGGKLAGGVINKVRSGSELSYYYDYQLSGDGRRRTPDRDVDVFSAAGRDLA